MIYDHNYYCLGQVFIDNVPHLKILMQRKDDKDLAISYFEMTSGIIQFLRESPLMIQGDV